jgi:hypothetical protein
MADDPSGGMPEDQSSPVPGGSPPVAAGGGGSQSGNLPPSPAPAAQAVQALGAKARGQEMVKAGMQLITMALPMLGIHTPEGESVMKMLQQGAKHFKQNEQPGGGGDQGQALMKLLAASQGRGGPQPGQPGPGGQGGPPQPGAMPRGPIPAMAG